LDVYKIGLTRRKADQRAKELSAATGVPLAFGILASWQVGDCAAVEREIYQRLKARRINPKREFFHGRLQDITVIVSDVVSESEPGR